MIRRLILQSSDGFQVLMERIPNRGSSLRKRTVMGATASRANDKSAVRIKRVGGHVQEITRPITVQEVMLQNPKHWVTKVNVFRSQNPVAEAIPPEAVLTQGQTVLLVPFRTMQALLERQHMCPASLDILMDRPGLACRKWYQQHHKTIAPVCPLEHCKCSYVKKNSSQCMVALSKESSVKVQTLEVGVMVDHVRRVGVSPEHDVKPKTNLECLEASKGGKGPISNDAMRHMSNKSNEVKMPRCANSMNDVKHENNTLRPWQPNKGQGSIAFDKNRQMRRKQPRNYVKHESIASNQGIITKHALKESVASHKKDRICRPQASTHRHHNKGKSSDVGSGNAGILQFFGACTCCPSSPKSVPNVKGANK